MKQTKENLLNEQCQIIISGLSKGNNKTAFGTLRKVTNPQQPKINAIEYLSLITETPAVTGRWT